MREKAQSEGDWTSRKHPQPKLDLKEKLKGFHPTSFLQFGVHPQKQTMGLGQNTKSSVKRMPEWHTKGSWLDIWLCWQDWSCSLCKIVIIQKMKIRTSSLISLQ